MAVKLRPGFGGDSAHKIKRKIALEAGLPYYFTGKPCKRGHIDSRYADGHCRQCKYEDIAARFENNHEWVKAAWRKFYATNRQKRIDVVAEYQKDNPDGVRARSHNRRARRLKADGSHAQADIASLRRMQSDKCAYCKTALKGRGHIDHIIPLALGGTNWPSNLQLTCHSCNSKKGWKSPEQFSREQGMLL